jgi:hypothetical protein
VNTWVPSRFVVGFGLFISLVFRVVSCFVFVLCLVCPYLSATYLAIFTKFICICVRSLSRDVKNSCNLLQGQSYIRTKCLSIFVQHEQIISPPFHEDRHNYFLSRIASPYDSSSYTHTIMFWLLPFYLLT